ncbi:hypothetical protein AGOR_G00137610 [Albula goreensis]|uniref:Uncharacterized protein n=1 Tax=Albula goreensis TaxID=1534307 RepID=A0A8T3DAP8_9TELE|nr:hypothetical protein AGOR_G00137610 [Albula goreensis]
MHCGSIHPFQKQGKGEKSLYKTREKTIKKGLQNVPFLAVASPSFSNPRSWARFFHCMYMQQRKSAFPFFTFPLDCCHAAAGNFLFHMSIQSELLQPSSGPHPPLLGPVAGVRRGQRSRKHSVSAERGTTPQLSSDLENCSQSTSSNEMTPFKSP